MPEQYFVRIATADLAFSAAHFITLDGDLCERLHGHNYRVSAEVHGPLDENQYVVDFTALHESLRIILAELDHRMLLPATSSLIRVAPGPDEVEVRFGDRRWVFPRGDCLLLPVANTTAELLARYIGRRLADDLEARTGRRPQRFRIEVAEQAGQSAVWEIGPS